MDTDQRDKTIESTRNYLEVDPERHDVYLCVGR